MPATQTTTVVQQTLNYTDDATIGTLAEPYIIQLNPTQGFENGQYDDGQGRKARKVIENGILYILRNGEKYDATGKRLSEK